MTMEDTVSVRNFFNGKTIFLTGATGFLGKFVVEKLINSCDVKKIYVLIRDKRGQSVQQRCHSYFNDQLFKFRTDPSRLKVIEAIAGDIGEENLGISYEDRKKITSEVDLVIHSAATVKFDEPLSVAMKMNVKATLSVLNLCKETVNLNLFVYVSTAFSGSCSERIEEIVSRPLTDPFEVLTLMKEQDVDTFNGVTFERIRGEHPNSYTCTKELSEAMVNDFSKANGIRTVITKPGIILPPIREPCAYYVENLNQGSQAVGASMGVGILTVVPGKVSNKFAGIPVDTCANALLISAADAAHKWQTEPAGSGEVAVYGLYNTSDNVIRNEHAFHVTCKSAQTYPTLKMVRPPVLCSFTSHPVVHNIQVWLFEFVFAFFFDLTCMMAGKSAKMVKVMTKAHKTMKVLAFFVSIDWIVSGQNVNKAFARLSNEEKRLFDIGLSQVDWNDYFEKFWLGIRKWVFREDLDNLQEARSKLKRLKLAYYSGCTLLIVMATLILWPAAKWCALAISVVKQQNHISNLFNSITA